MDEKDRILTEIEELEKEIEGIKKRIPPHSVRHETIQLTEGKERELGRKKVSLNQRENDGSNSMKNPKAKLGEKVMNGITVSTGVARGRVCIHKNIFSHVPTFLHISA
jgi:hypothetical protein